MSTKPLASSLVPPHQDAFVPLSATSSSASRATLVANPFINGAAWNLMIGSSSSMMSSSNGEVVVGVGNTYLCASCGITEGDDVKLKICTACRFTRYCSVACQKLHRPQHKVECRKRADELRDDLLFTQPDGTHLGECPICLLPQPLNGPTHQKSGLMSCCSQLICKGCAHANKLRVLEEGLEPKCAFCRQGLPRTESEADANRRKRMKAGDVVAIREIGARRYNTARNRREVATFFELHHLPFVVHRSVCAAVIYQ